MKNLRSSSSLGFLRRGTSHVGMKAVFLLFGIHSQFGFSRWSLSTAISFCEIFENSLLFRCFLLEIWRLLFFWGGRGGGKIHRVKQPEVEKKNNAFAGCFHCGLPTNGRCFTEAWSAPRKRTLRISCLWWLVLLSIIRLYRLNLWIFCWVGSKHPWIKPQQIGWVFLFTSMHQKDGSFFLEVICLLSQFVMEKNQIHECSLQIVGWGSVTKIPLHISRSAWRCQFPPSSNLWRTCHTSCSNLEPATHRMLGKYPFVHFYP